MVTQSKTIFSYENQIHYHFESSQQLFALFTGLETQKPGQQQKLSHSNPMEIEKQQNLKESNYICSL